MPVEVEIDEGVAVLTVSNPGLRNALDVGLAEELIVACEQIDADLSVGAAMLRGGDGTFCSGADRALLDARVDQASDQQYKAMGLIYSSFRRVGALAVPTVAAVRGAVVGAGTNLMLATDLRVVADDVKVLAGFLRIGLHPGGGFFTLAGRTAGREGAAALGLFGETLVGRQVVDAGFAYEAVPDEEVETRALALAKVPAVDPELARLATVTMRAELGPPGVDWDVAINFERPSQMWSMSRRVV